MSKSQLPRAYAPFAELFAQMDLPLNTIINGILKALAGASPPVSAFENQPDGDFIGYDGLDNRGRLSHLLETEWLLRELDPDDFVRRISEGEILYRRRNFANAGTRNTFAVIVDCGPWMLGRQRLIALAALFYLSARAAASQATLHWIIPGEAGRVWEDTLDQDSIAVFLGNVVQKSLTQADITQALATLEPQGKCDVWYVGAAQTAQVTEHPDVGASFLIRPLLDDGSDTHSSEIQIRNRGRHIAKTEVTFPNDQTCVAALRRPFKPSVQATPTARDITKRETQLSALPFRTEWQLDRINQAVIIRFEGGVLWQPLRDEYQDDGVWLPVEKSSKLLGFHVARDRMVTALVAENTQDTAAAKVSVLGVALGNAAASVSVKGQSATLFENAQYPNNAVGQFMAHTGYNVVQRDGKLLAFPSDGNGALSELKQQWGPVLWTDGTYAAVCSDADDQVIIWNVARNAVLFRTSRVAGLQDIIKAARHTLISPSCKVLSISTDGHNYANYSNGDDVQDFELRDGLCMVNMISAEKALVWSAEDATLIQLTIGPRKSHEKPVATYSGPRVDTPRSCPFSGAVFAMHYDDAGMPTIFAPIMVKRDWREIKPLNVADALEKARTVWLKS